MKVHLFRIVGASLMLLAGQAMAEDPSPGRYSMQRVEGGIARLDTQTGEVALCREADEQLTCHLAADERTAFELELDLLTKRVETLEKALESAQTPMKPRLPTKEEIDQTLTVMERMMRSFMGIVKGLDGGQPASPAEPDVAPQKT